MQNYFNTISLPFFTTDFDYFRIPRVRWELMLTRLKQMGTPAVTLTMPWAFHEFEPGTVDLQGTTMARRDVVGLLNLCLALDFRCILKPGPYSQHGVLGNGIPAWLLNKSSGDFEAALPTSVEGWYKALSQTLTGQQWPDGPIIALQIDSEASQRPATSYSKQLTEVKWRIWLRKRYHRMEALNEAYGTTYRTVNEVIFPETWANAETPLEKDAKEFLETVRQDTQGQYQQILVEAGWQIPIYSPAQVNEPDLPAIQTYALTKIEEDLPALDKILNLPEPIQVEPDPVEVGQGPVWAQQAPIRMDGSLRVRFWAVRQALWPHTLPQVNRQDKTLSALFAPDGLVTCGGDTPLKIEVTPETRPKAYRLRLNGELLVEPKLRVRRGKLSGPYRAEDEVDQTDLVFFLNDPSGPLSGFPLTYLSSLLVAQAQTLSRCASLAEGLGQALAVPPEGPDRARPERPAKRSYTLDEARRGLQEADVALRKAMSSISKLEGGFATILDKSSAEVTPQPAPAPVIISPEIFEGAAREILIEVGRTCTEIGPQLKAAAATLQQTIDTPNGFTVEQYQQSYTTAVTTAQATRESLLEIIAQLRLEIASERLPLVTWRVHDQVQAIAETLRWGVWRG